MAEKKQDDKKFKRKLKVRPSLSKSSVPTSNSEKEVKTSKDIQHASQDQKKSDSKKRPSISNIEKKDEKEIKFTENDLKRAKFNLQRNFAIFH